MLKSTRIDDGLMPRRSTVDASRQRELIREVVFAPPDGLSDNAFSDSDISYKYSVRDHRVLSPSNTIESPKQQTPDRAAARASRHSGQRPI